MAQRIPPAPIENFEEGESRGTSMLSRVMMQAPTAAARLAPFIRAIFAELQLDPFDRELVTLYAIHLEGGAFQWAQHEHIAPNLLGVPIQQVHAIACDDVEGDVFSDRHKALLRFTRLVVKEVRVDDASFAEMAAHFPDREIVEVLLTIGNYMMLCRISEVLCIPPDAPSVGAAALNAAVESVRLRKPPAT